MTGERFQKGEFTAWVGIIGNLVLVLLKALIGLVSNSKALLASAAHSATDAVRSFELLIGVKAGKRSQDEDDRPYEFGKSAMIAAIVVSILMIIVGLHIGFSSAKSIYVGVSQAPGSLALAAIIGSIILKEAMFQYRVLLGKQSSSQELRIHAWEHRSSMYISLVALFGAGGALLGTLWDWPMMYYLDPIAGLMISLLVILKGIRRGMESIQKSAKPELHPETIAEMLEVVNRVAGVITVDDLRAKEQGYFIIVEINISVNPYITVQEGHEIARNVKQRLMMKYAQINDVFVYVNPYDPGYPYNSDLDAARSAHPTILH